MTNGRAKGSRAELEVVALIQPWWQRVEPGALFVRTPLSGGWGKPEHREGFQSGGDIMTTAKRWPWCVEVKRREGWTETTLRAGRPSPVWGWWRQAIVAANEMGKAPALFFRKSHHPWLLMLPSTDPTVALDSGPWMLWPRRGPRRLAQRLHGDFHPTVFLAANILALDPELFAR